MVEQAAGNDASNLTIAFEEHVQSVVRYADALLLDIREDVLEDPEGLDEVVKEELEVYGDMFAQVAIIRADGQLVYSSLGPISEKINLSSREHFQVHRNNPSQDKLFISKPVLGKISGVWSIQFTRPILSLNGFAGVIVLSIPIKFFTDFYEKINIGQNGLIALVGLDRVPRAAASKNLLNVKLEGLVLPKDKLYFYGSNPREGVIREASAFTAMDSLVAYRRLKQTELIVMVELSPADYLAPYAERRDFLVYSAGISSALLVAFVVFVFFATKQHLGNAAALKQAHQALQHLVSVDLLTGARSRGDFYEALTVEFNRAKRHNTELSLIGFDLDHFKKVNDTYGHPVGDVVLKQIARVCSNMLRGHDVFGRLGGEEFGVILPHTDSKEALNVAEKLRLAVENTSIGTERGTIQVTISLGVSSALPSGDSPGQLVVRADDALYSAKRAGRNTVAAAPVNPLNKNIA
ncbi:sensor domain-containing diguanylate cyclase [Pseudomonas sp. R3-41]